MGDGERIELDKEKLRQELLDGTRDAAEKGKIPELAGPELEQLFEIIAEPGRIVSVPPGEELIVTDDGVAENLHASEADGGAGIPMDPLSCILTYERGVAADTASTGNEDYSFKYFQPDGPFPNPAELMPLGEIDAARKAQEDAAEALKEDMIFVGKKLNEMGCEGLNFDTAASSGDADFYATLEAVRELKRSCPNMSLIVGMSSESVLGMHGEIFFDEQRLAGMFPHKQAKIVEAAGADIFGVAVNVNTSRTVPWNLSKAVTFVKNTVEEARIPVHPNVGMGVCGIPMMVDGMGGIRTAGDLVAWMQMTRKMKLPEAKQYVAERLGVSILELTDEDVMYPLREELGIGVVTAKAGGPKGIMAKARIAKLLGIEINSVNLFKQRMEDQLRAR
jgi:dimethylamine--corrinoid protein Co-methyltransferase